jgi:hypothetical protein
MTPPAAMAILVHHGRRNSERIRLQQAAQLQCERDWMRFALLLGAGSRCNAMLLWERSLRQLNRSLRERLREGSEDVSRALLRANRLKERTNRAGLQCKGCWALMRVTPGRHRKSSGR